MPRTEEEELAKIGNADSIKTVSQSEALAMADHAFIFTHRHLTIGYNGNRIGQGKDNVREYLKEHKELAIEIENRVRENQGIVSRAAEFVPTAEDTAE